MLTFRIVPSPVGKKARAAVRPVACFVLASLFASAVACGGSDPPPKPLGKSTVPPNRPTTSQALATAAVAALHASDPQAALDLLVTVFDIGRTCPKMNPKFLSHRDKLVANTKAAYAECQTLADWSSPTVVSVKGGDNDKEAADMCPGAMMLHDIVITVQTGGKTVELKVDDPMAINGVVLMGESPKCKLVESAPAP